MARLDSRRKSRARAAGVTTAPSAHRCCVVVVVVTVAGAVARALAETADVAAAGVGGRDDVGGFGVDCGDYCGDDDCAG